MQLKDAVKRDRDERRNLSRRKYAELTGLSETRVHSLEHGRKINAGEVELLLPFLGDLLDPDLVAAHVDREVTPREDTTEAEENDAVQFERTQLAYAYLTVMKKLGHRVPPHAWPSQFRLETAPPIEFPAIREWIQTVDSWADGDDAAGAASGVGGQTDMWPQGAEGNSHTSEDAPAPDPAPLPFPVDTSEDDFDVEEVTPEEEIESIQHPTVTTPREPAPAVHVDYGELVLDEGLWYVTNGERKTWLECQRRWYLESYQKLGFPTRRVTGAAAVGTRFHRPLAAWYQPVPGDPWKIFEADAAADREYLDDVGARPETRKDLEQEIDLVRAMLEGYFEWIEESSVDAGLVVVAPEAVIMADPKFPTAPHVRVLAKLDVRVLDQKDNSRWFIDHKSVQDFTSAIRTLRGDEQMLHYHLIEWLKLIEEGLDTELRAGGAYYNMARKVKRTATANPPFYAREPVTHNVHEIRSYWQRVKGTVDQMTTARLRLANGDPHQEVVPPNWTRDCSWKCEFFTMCPMMDDAASHADAYAEENLVEVNPLARYEPDAVGETV